jgi:hypothetical protein
MPYLLGNTFEEAEAAHDRTLELLNLIIYTIDERFSGQYQNVLTKSLMEDLAARRSFLRQEGRWNQEQEQDWQRRLEPHKYRYLNRAQFDNPLELSEQEKHDLFIELAACLLTLKDMAEELAELRVVPLLEEETEGVSPKIDAIAIIDLRHEILALAETAAHSCVFDHGSIKETAFQGFAYAMGYIATLGLDEQERGDVVLEPLRDGSISPYKLMNRYIGEARRYFADQRTDLGAAGTMT